MQAADIMQKCLDLSAAAMALFDLVEADGIDAPLNKMENISILKAVIDDSFIIKEYYSRRNIQQMLALGISPAALLRMTERQ